MQPATNFHERKKKITGKEKKIVKQNKAIDERPQQQKSRWMIYHRMRKN